MPKILVLSSISPSVGPAAVAFDRYVCLKRAGYDVDILCLDRDSKFPEVKGILSENKLVNRLQRLYLKLRFFILTALLKQKPGYFFFHKREPVPEVPVGWVLRGIKREYDIVDVVFWQKMLSYKTILELYRKLKCEIRFYCVDFGPSTGGCHFPGECDRYEKGCGYCPAIGSSKADDFTACNLAYRKSVVEEVKPYVLVNKYMKASHLDRSSLFSGYPRVREVITYVNLSVFRPIPCEGLRDKYNIPENKDFLIFLGSQSLTDERKGTKYAIESLNILSERLGPEDASRVMVLLAGDNGDELGKHLSFDYKALGYVGMDALVELYNISDAFLCASVNDCGPLMVNYSISCGTPVVAFEMGAAMSIVMGQGTGYCAKLRDSQDMADGLISLFRMDGEERRAIRTRCRVFAEENMSEEAFVKQYFEIDNDSRAI